MSDMYKVYLQTLTRIDPMDVAAYSDDEYAPEARWLAARSENGVVSVFDVIECFQHHFSIKLPMSEAESIFEEMISAARIS